VARIVLFEGTTKEAGVFPILLQMGPITIRSYGVLIATAVMVGWLLARRDATRNHLAPALMDDFLTWGLLFGLAGARIDYVVFSDFASFLRNPFEIIAVWHGGLAVQGAILGGVGGALWFCRRRGLSFWKLADTAAPALIVGQAIGRIACLLNGDAYGKPTGLPWAITFTNPDSLAPKGIPLHPTQLYEFDWDLLVFALLRLLGRKPRAEGILFLWYAGLYSLGRFVIESFRGDQLTYRLGPYVLSTAMTLSALAVVGAIVGGFLLRSRQVQSA